MDTLGIDIGTTTVKYVRYGRTTDRIVSRGEYRYRRGWEDFRDILSAIAEKEGTRVAVAVGITSIEILKKTYSVPVRLEPEMKNEVDTLASKGMAVPLADMNRRHLMLGEVEERGTPKQDVLFLGAHTSFVYHVFALFRKAGFRRLLLLTDVAFCYEPMIDYALDGSVAVVDIGGTQTGIYIIDSGRLLLIREVMTACETFRDAVVGDMALSPNEAEEHLWINGFGEASEGTLAISFERLAAQIQRTFLVYSQKYPRRPVSKVWVAGRGARIPGLTEKLNLMLAEHFDVLPPRAEVEQEYVPAYSLATRSDRFPNLLTEEMIGNGREAVITRYAKAVGIIIVMGIALFSFAAWAGLHYLTTTVDERLSVLSQKRQQLTGYDPARRPQSGREESVHKEIGEKETAFVVLLKYLSSRLPSQVYLKSVDFDASRATDKGVGVKDIRHHSGLKKSYRLAVVHLRGCTTGEDADAEAVMMHVVTTLEKSGFMSDVRIVHKEMKNVNGKTFTEFVVSGECRGYEI